jgi:hypothetical protein
VKRCTMCREDKLITCFRTNGRGSLASNCNVCHRVAERTRYRAQAATEAFLAAEATRKRIEYNRNQPLLWEEKW